MDATDGEGHALGGMNKTFCSDPMQSVVFDCMRIVGVNALDRRFAMAKFFRESMVFPLYDAGNLAMQQRRAWGVMADPSFTPDPSSTRNHSNSGSPWKGSGRHRSALRNVLHRQASWGRAAGSRWPARRAKGGRSPAVARLLLHGKYRVPSRRPGTVARSRLTDGLGAATRSPLTVLSAPAGFGKTTLLTEWIAGLPSDDPTLRIG